MHGHYGPPIVDRHLRCEKKGTEKQLKAYRRK